MLGTSVQYTDNNGSTWNAAIVTAVHDSSVDLAVWKGTDGPWQKKTGVTDSGTVRYQAVPA